MVSKENVLKSPNPNGYTFSEKEFQVVKELGAVFQQIHNRLMKEGYRIEDGVLYAPDGSVEYRRPRR